MSFTKNDVVLCINVRDKEPSLGIVITISDGPYCVHIKMYNNNRIRTFMSNGREYREDGLPSIYNINNIKLLSVLFL